METFKVFKPNRQVQLIRDENLRKISLDPIRKFGIYLIAASLPHGSGCGLLDCSKRAFIILNNPDWGVFCLDRFRMVKTINDYL